MKNNQNIDELQSPIKSEKRIKSEDTRQFH